MYATGTCNSHYGYIDVTLTKQSECIIEVHVMGINVAFVTSK